MFCTNCGGKLPDNANFCVNCGSRAAAARPAGPAIGSAGQVIATPVVAVAPPPRSATKCSWCGAAFDPGQTTCPKCGAALSASSIVSKSGWAKLPGRKDMAKINFGKSVCQIEGTQVPVADMKLAAEDSIYFTHHVLLWKDPQVSITAMSMKGGWKRMLGGLPLIMTQAQGPGHIAFSQDSPGELIALPLQHGQAVDVREHLFLAATGNVDYDWFSTNIWFQSRVGDETETHYPLGRVMDRFAATGAPGLLLLHAAGNVFTRDLSPGQVILLKPSALVFKDPTVQMEIYYESPSVSLGAWISGTRGYLWLRLTGPGRVAIQSVFDRIEGEDNYASGGFSGSGGGIGGLVMGEVIGEVASSIFEAFGDS